jgi:hypothetical protein
MERLLLMLASQGNYPAISYRGYGVWRAHINGTGNFWADGNTPFGALNEAIRIWEKKGKPKDGYAT